jgi:hypothetical protein
MSENDNFLEELQDPNYSGGNQKDRSTANGLGIAGLVIGIVALLVSFIPCFGIFALFFGIIGIVLSAIGLHMANKGGFEKGLIIAGLALSIVATVISGIQWAVAGSAMKQAEQSNKLLIEELKKNQNFEDALEEEMEKLDNSEDTLESDGVN